MLLLSVSLFSSNTQLPTFPYFVSLVTGVDYVIYFKKKQQLNGKKKVILINRVNDLQKHNNNEQN